VRIIGVDPGLANSGYGIIEEQAGSLKTIEYACITTSKDDPFPQRLREIYDDFAEVLREFKPDACSIEALYFAKNAKSAFQVGHARGVFILCASLEGIPVFEYTPIQIKKAIVGRGRADKQQVQYMTKVILNLEEEPQPDHAADALAAAICHSNSDRLREMTGNQRKVYK